MNSIRLLPPLFAATLLLAIGGCSTKSNPVTPDTAYDTAPPSGPSNVHAGLSADARDDSLIWSASPSPDVTGYQVYAYAPDPSSTSSYVKIADVPGTETWWLVPDDTEDRVWHLRVRAVDSSGNLSVMSNVVKITVVGSGTGSVNSDPGEKTPRIGGNQ